MGVKKPIYNILQEEMRESPEIRKLLKNSLDMLLNLLNGESGSIMLLDPERNVLNLLSYKGLKEEIAKMREVSLENGISGYVIKEGIPLILNKGDKFLGKRLPRDDIRSSIVLPIISNGERIGVISVNRITQNEEFSTSDLDFAILLSRYIFAFLMNLIISNRMRRELSYLKVVYNVSRELREHKKLTCLARIVTEGMIKLTDSDLGMFLLYEGENGRLKTIYSKPPKDKEELLRLELILNRMVGNREKVFDEAFLYLPILNGGEIVGVLYLEHPDTDRYDLKLTEAIEFLLEEARFYIKNSLDYFSTKEYARIEERTRISRELHDIVAQGIAEGIIKIQLIKRFIEREDKGEAYKEASSLETMLGGVLNEIRSVIFEERPLKVEKRLFDQLRRYIDELNKGGNIRYKLILSGDEKFISQKKEEIIFYIVREALANIRRHSNASNAVVELSIGDEGIDLIISDDGKGFDMEQYEKKKSEGFGIKIMEERAELFGGQFRIESSPNNGTRIDVNIPL
ncbi:MAG: GAF domain-containing protein [bacterium]